LLPISSCHSSTTTWLDRLQFLARVLAREHHAQRLGRGDQHGREAAVLPRAFGAGGVAGALAQRPGGREVLQRRGQRARGVGGQGAHRRDPEHAQRLGGAPGRVRLQQRVQHAEPHRIGLAGAGGGVQHAAAALRHGLPHLALEGERFPAPGGEPLLARRRHASIVDQRPRAQARGPGFPA
jgi:hypothetical protein